MAKRLGRDFKLWLLLSGEWVELPGERSSSIKFSNEPVDTTEKSDGQWRVLSPCGVRFGETVGIGVVRDNLTRGVWNSICQSSFDGSLVHIRIESTGDIVGEGDYQVTNLERTGDYGDSERFSITFQSAGPLASDVIDSFDLLTEDGQPINTEDNLSNLLVES